MAGGTPSNIYSSRVHVLASGACGKTCGSDKPRQDALSTLNGKGEWETQSRDVYAASQAGSQDAQGFSLGFRLQHNATGPQPKRCRGQTLDMTNRSYLTGIWAHVPDKSLVVCQQYWWKYSPNAAGLTVSAEQSPCTAHLVVLRARLPEELQPATAAPAAVARQLDDCVGQLAVMHLKLPLLLLEDICAGFLVLRNPRHLQPCSASLRAGSIPFMQIYVQSHLVMSHLYLSALAHVM